MFSLATLCNPDAFKPSYYKIIVYSFLSTVVTFEGPLSRFHN